MKYLKHSDDQGYEECYICIEPVKHKQKIAKLSCKHKFHKHCYNKWINSKHNKTGTNCPVCGAEFLQKKTLRDCKSRCIIL